MKRLALVPALFLASSLLIAKEASSYGLDVDVQPGPGHPDSYLCIVAVTDLSTGETVMAPHISVLGNATATVTTMKDDIAYELTVIVESQGSKATAELKVSRGETIVAHQRSALAIR